MTRHVNADDAPVRCIFPGCVSTDRHWHGWFPGGYDNPDDPEGSPILFTSEPAPGVRDYNGATSGHVVGGGEVSLIDREKLRARLLAGYTQEFQTQEWHDAVGWSLALIDAAPAVPSLTEPATVDWMAVDRLLALAHREDDQPCSCDECMSYGAEDAGFDWYKTGPVRRIALRVLDGPDNRHAPLRAAIVEHEDEVRALATPEGTEPLAASPDKGEPPMSDCIFVPANEPWSCSVHPGGLRTRLDEPFCDVVRPAEPFNEAYLDNIRASIAEGKKLQGHYIIRRLIATIDAERAFALIDAAPPADPLAGLTVEPVEVVSWNRPTTSREEYVGILDAAAKVEWHSNHEAELPVGPILAALRGQTLRGLWVQVVGDEFRVSVQYDFAGAVMAKDGHGPTVREASKALLAALRATSSEGQER